MVNLFYSLGLYSLEKILTKTRFNKIKKGIKEAAIYDTIFFPQWFEIISLDYAKMDKASREKKFMNIMNTIYNYGNYVDYIEMKTDIINMCKEKGCTLDDIHYEDYPEDINWQYKKELYGFNSFFNGFHGNDLQDLVFFYVI